MKNLLLFFALSLAIISCKKEGCTYSDANNYDPQAEKDDGSCDYTDPTPPVLDPREEFTGSYLVKDSAFINGSFSEVQNYTLLVSYENTVSDTLFFKNLWNDGASYIMILSGNSFTMPSQQVSGPYYASGSGTIQNENIEYTTSGDAYLNIGEGQKQ